MACVINEKYVGLDVIMTQQIPRNAQLAARQVAAASAAPPVAAQPAPHVRP